MIGVPHESPSSMRNDVPLLDLVPLAARIFLNALLWDVLSIPTLVRMLYGPAYHVMCLTTIIVFPSGG